MKKTKKIVSFGLAAAMMFGTLSSAYAMPNNSVIIGNKGYSLDYFFNEPLLPEIVTALESGGDLFFDAEGAGFVDAWDGSEMTAEEQSQLKNIEYLQADGKKVIYENFEDETPKVEGKIVVESVSAITKTKVTVVLAEKPEAELTDANADEFEVLVNGTANVVKNVTKDVADVNEKSYVLTLTDSLDKTQGNVTVNGAAPTDKIVEGSEYDYDYKAPTILGVEVLDSTHIKVNYSEKMDETTATDLTKVILMKNTAPAASDDAAEDLLGSTAVATLSADGKSVIYKTEAALVPAAYTFKVAAGIQDISTLNAVYTGTEVVINPTGDELADVQGPQIQGATYNSGLGVLTLTFDEEISTAAGKIDYSKVTLGGVELTSSTTVARQAGTNKYDFTLPSAVKADVNGIAGDLKVSLAEGAIQDMASTPNANDAVTDFAVAKTTPPVATSASYDEETNLLTINFDQPVSYKAGDVNLAKVTVKANGTSTTLNPAGTVKSKENTSTLVIEVNASDASTIESAAGTVEAGTIDIAAAGFENVSGTTNLLLKDIELTYIQDNEAPTITSAVYNNVTEKLEVTFSEDVDLQDASFDETKFVLTDGTNDVILAEANYIDGNQSGTSGKVAVFEMNANAGTPAENVAKILSDESIIAGSFELDLSKLSLYVSAKDVVDDLQGNGLAEIKAVDAISVTYQDFISPKVDSTATAIDAKNIDVAFTDEKGLDLDKATVENTANYTVALASNGSDVKAVSKAVLQPDGRTVRLTLEEAHTVAGMSYKVTVKDVKDAAGNAVITGSNDSATYTSSITLDETAPVVNNLVVTSVKGENNDTIAVTFSEDVDATTATNLANYTIETPVGTQLGLNKDNASISYVVNTATITLKGINLQDGDDVKVVVGAGILDKAGNALDRTQTANYVKEKTVTKSSTAKIENSVVAKAGNTEDTIEFYFDEVVNKSDAEQFANYVLESNTSTPLTTAPKSIVATVDDNETTATTDDKTKVVISYESGTLTVGNTVKVNVAANAVHDIAGKAVGAGAHTAIVKDGVKPLVEKVEATAVSGLENDVITITFKDADIFNATGIGASSHSRYVIKDSKGNVVNNSDNSTIAFNNATPDTVTITFDQTGANAVNLDSNETYTITITGITDETGNAMDATTKTIAWDASTDKTAAKAVLAGTTVTEGAPGTGKIALALSEEVTKASAENIGNYTVQYSADGSFTDTVTYNVVDAVLAGSAKSVDLTVAETIPASGFGKIKIVQNNLVDIAGNVQTTEETVTVAH